MFRLSYNYGNGVGAAILQTLDSSVKIVESIMELHSKMKHSASSFFSVYWDKEQQSKAQNLDSKYRQMALVGFDS